MPQRASCGHDSRGVPIRSDIPARLDRLPWSRWHWRVVIALGVAWMLDGLEVTIVGSIGSVLERPDTLGPERRADRLGRVALRRRRGARRAGVRPAGRSIRTQAPVPGHAGGLHGAPPWPPRSSTGFAWFALCRFFTGLGIGGEYAAINSAIDELIPARVRGRVDLAINGSFWIGAALGALISLVLLDARVLGPQQGWRAGFLLGAVLAVAILLVRRACAREPALAAHARPRRRGRAHRRADRGRRSRAQHGRAARCRARHGGVQAARGTDAGAKSAHVLSRRYRTRSVRRARADGVAGVLLQRDLLHLRAGADALLRRRRRRAWACTSCRSPLGNVLGPLLLGPLFDRVGPARDDRRHLRAVGRRRLLLTGIGFAHGLARRDARRRWPGRWCSSSRRRRRARPT